MAYMAWSIAIVCLAALFANTGTHGKRPALLPELEQQASASTTSIGTPTTITRDSPVAGVDYTNTVGVMNPYGATPENQAEVDILNVWPAELGTSVLTLSRCESASEPVNPKAISPNTKHGKSYGAFQMNKKFQTRRFEKLGYDFATQWSDPIVSATVALDLYREQSWSPWTCSYGNHLGWIAGTHNV